MTPCQRGKPTTGSLTRTHTGSLHYKCGRTNLTTENLVTARNPIFSPPTYARHSRLALRPLAAPPHSIGGTDHRRVARRAQCSPLAAHRSTAPLTAPPLHFTARPLHRSIAPLHRSTAPPLHRSPLTVTAPGHRALTTTLTPTQEARSSPPPGGCPVPGQNESKGHGECCGEGRRRLVRSLLPT